MEIESIWAACELIGFFDGWIKQFFYLLKQKQLQNGINL